MLLSKKLPKCYPPVTFTNKNLPHTTNYPLGLSVILLCSRKYYKSVVLTEEILPTSKHSDPPCSVFMRNYQCSTVTSVTCQWSMDTCRQSRQTCTDRSDSHVCLFDDHVTHSCRKLTCGIMGKKVKLSVCAHCRSIKYGAGRQKIYQSQCSEYKYKYYVKDREFCFVQVLQCQCTYLTDIS
jgi:hypothetical protein